MWRSREICGSCVRVHGSSRKAVTRTSSSNRRGYKAVTRCGYKAVTRRLQGFRPAIDAVQAVGREQRRELVRLMRAAIDPIPRVDAWISREPARAVKSEERGCEIRVSGFGFSAAKRTMRRKEEKRRGVKLRRCEIEGCISVTQKGVNQRP